MHDTSCIASLRVPGPGPYHPGPGAERLQHSPGNFQLRWSMQYECSSRLQNILTKPARHMPSSSCSNSNERSSGSQSTSGGCGSSEDSSEEATSQAGEQGSQSEGSTGSPSQLVAAPPPRANCLGPSCPNRAQRAQLRCSSWPQPQPAGCHHGAPSAAHQAQGSR